MHNSFTYNIFLCMLLAGYAKAAFKDFVVTTETELEEYENYNDLGSGYQAEDQQNLISFQDVLNEDIVDTELFVSALMQHAQRLGLNLEQLAQIHSYGQDEPISGCSGAESFSYEQQPSWSDIFFN